MADPTDRDDLRSDAGTVDPPLIDDPIGDDVMPTGRASIEDAAEGLSGGITTVGGGGVTGDFGGILGADDVLDDARRAAHGKHLVDPDATVVDADAIAAEIARGRVGGSGPLN